MAPVGGSARRASRGKPTCPRLQVRRWRPKHAIERREDVARRVAAARERELVERRGRGRGCGYGRGEVPRVLLKVQGRCGRQAVAVAEGRLGGCGTGEAARGVHRASEGLRGGCQPKSREYYERGVPKSR